MKPAAKGSTSIDNVAIVDVEKGCLIKDQTILIEVYRCINVSN